MSARHVGRVLLGTAISSLVGVGHAARKAECSAVADRSRAGGNARLSTARAAANRAKQTFPSEGGERSHKYGIARRDFGAEGEFTRT
jgi:hypothetical protein